MIRVVLAVALSTALLGIGLPSAERADRDRNAALATAELDRTAQTAAQLVAENDPVGRAETPAATTLTLVPPDPTFPDAGGRFRIIDDELLWEPSTGRPRSVVPPVPIRVEEPLTVAERTRIRLLFVRVDGESVVRARIEGESPDRDEFPDGERYSGGSVQLLSDIRYNDRPQAYYRYCHGSC